MTCHFIRHISFQIEIVSDKQKTAGGHRPSAVYYPKRFGFKPLNRFQKVSDRSERDETCTCGTCTCTSSSLRCSASSSMLSAFPRDLSVCFDVGIVAPFRPFVKHFFQVFFKVFRTLPDFRTVLLICDCRLCSSDLITLTYSFYVVKHFF